MLGERALRRPFLWATNRRRGCDALGLHEVGLIAVSAEALVSPCWASPFWQSPDGRPRPKEPKSLAPASGLGVPGSLRSTALIPSLLRASPRRAPGTLPERGDPGAAGAGCRGKRFCLLFWQLKKVSRPAGRNQCLGQLANRDHSANPKLRASQATQIVPLVPAESSGGVNHMSWRRLPRAT